MRGDSEAQPPGESLGPLAHDAPVAMFVARGDGHLVRVNEAFRHLLGWSEEVLLTTRIEELIHPEDRGPAAAELARVAAEGTVSALECRITVTPGVYRWLQLTVSGDPGGTVRGSARDISSRRDSEATQAGLLRIARAVAAGARPPEVFQAVAVELARLLGVEAGVVFRLKDPFGVAVGVTGAHDIRLGTRVPIGREGALAQVFARARPSRTEIDRMPEDDPIRRVYERNGYRASVAAPVLVGGAIWGAVLASTTRADPLPDDAEQRLNLFSELVSAAIANAEAQGQLTAHATEQAALYRVAASVAEQADLGEILALAAEEAARLLGADAGGVVRFDPAGDSCGVLLASWSAPGLPSPALGTRIPADGTTAVSAVFDTGRRARIDGPADRDGGAGRLSPDSPYRREAAAPVRVGGGLWGAVTVALVDDRALAADAVDRLARFAHLVELAISSTEARERLATLATTDALTGLLNRGAFQERLAAELARAERHGHPLCLAILDLDHFKAVNDDHGHQAGDQVLAEVARRLEAVSRNGETLSRLGGEEFGWILPETALEGALAAAERARQAVGDAPIGAVERVTVSIGVGERRAGSDPEVIFREADSALYRAKAEGRNRTSS